MPFIPSRVVALFYSYSVNVYILWGSVTEILEKESHKNICIYAHEVQLNSMTIIQCIYSTCNSTAARQQLLCYLVAGGEDRELSLFSSSGRPEFSSGITQSSMLGSTSFFCKWAKWILCPWKWSQCWQYIDAIWNKPLPFSYTLYNIHNIVLQLHVP